MELKNTRLRVRFADPQEVQTQRFDRTAIVTDVVLDDQYSFCVPEQVLSTRRTTNGIGLCGEFVLADAAESAKAGHWFCKPGVGLLKQVEDGMPYDMWKHYELRPFQVTVNAARDQILFQQKALPCGGYAVDIQKFFALQGNRLILDVTVRNSGEKECSVQEYQHNFVSLERLEVSEGYVLDLHCDRTLPQIVDHTLRQGDEIRLPSAVHTETGRVCWETDMRERILYHRSDDIDHDAPYRWTLQHLRSRASITEETSFCPTRIDIWAVEHCICTEFYNSVRLAPGETAQWRRTWTFDA